MDERLNATRVLSVGGLWPSVASIIYYFKEVHVFASSQSAYRIDCGFQLSIYIVIHSIVFFIQKSLAIYISRQNKEVGRFSFA